MPSGAASRRRRSSSTSRSPRCSSPSRSAARTRCGRSSPSARWPASRRWSATPPHALSPGTSSRQGDPPERAHPAQPRGADRRRRQARRSAASSSLSSRSWSTRVAAAALRRRALSRSRRCLGPERQLSQAPPDFDSLVAGVRFILKTKMLLGAIALDLFGVLLGDSIALAPGVRAARSSTSARSASASCGAAPAVGALAAAMLIARQPAAAAGWADAARRRGRLRRVDRRVRVLEVVPGLAARAGSQRLRGHDQRQHPLDGRRARDPERAARARAVPWSGCSSARPTSSARSSPASRRPCRHRHRGRCRRGRHGRGRTPGSGRSPRWRGWAGWTSLRTGAGVGSKPWPPLDRSTIWPYEERGEPGESTTSATRIPTGVEAERVLGELEGGHGAALPLRAGATTALVLCAAAAGRHDRPRRGRVLRDGRAPSRSSRAGASATSSSTRPAPPPDGVQLVWLEAPSNPFLTMPDLEAAAAHPAPRRRRLDRRDAAPPAAARARRRLRRCTARRSTSAATTTCCSARSSAATRRPPTTLRGVRTRTGIVAAPDPAWLLLRGLKTLAVRVRAPVGDGHELAGGCARIPKVADGALPGLRRPALLRRRRRRRGAPGRDLDSR